MAKYRVGVIGAGMIANAGHIPGWKSVGDDVEVVAVANPTLEKAQLTAANEGIAHVYDDWRQMLDEMDLDIVSVCTPNAYHKEQTIAAVEAGAHVVRHTFNLGQGAALQTGINFALSEGADLIVTMDADGQHDPSDIANMVAELEATGADVALGDRFSGRAIGITWRRRIILKCAWFFIRMTSGREISDSQIGLRLFSADAAVKLTITQNRMAYASELINQITRLKLKIIEIPVSVTYTNYSIRKGQSGFNSINILIDLIVGRLVK